MIALLYWYDRNAGLRKSQLFEYIIDFEGGIIGSDSVVFSGLCPY